MLFMVPGENRMCPALAKKREYRENGEVRHLP
jgi:hypothetical protein